MAFQGQSYSVNYDNITMLGRLGVDVIFIEKEGIVEKLTPFTTGLGIALVHSQGFYAEYAEMLADESLTYRGNIGILTDFDATGINIGLKIKGPVRKAYFKKRGKDGKLYDDEKNPVWVAFYVHTPKRLGIDVQTLQYLGLSVRDLEENALDKNGEPSHIWQGLHNTLQGIKKRNRDDEWTEEQKRFYFSYLTEEHNELGEGQDGNGVSCIEYLRNKRIELDTVVNVVGAEKFWEWLQDRILDTFETRDYNRAITVPRYVATPTIEEFQKRIKRVIESSTADRHQEVIEELRNVTEHLETEDKLDEIKADLLDNYVLKDTTVQKIDAKLQELVDQLPPAEDEEDESEDD